MYPWDGNIRQREPLRGWHSSGLSAQNDAKFIRNAEKTVENPLPAKFDRVDIRHSPIDADHRFLCGYSNSGMMAYKLAHDVPDMFAALWVISAEFGGPSHEGLGSTATNDPQGSSNESLFANQEEDDVAIPTGPRNDPTGRDPNSIEYGVYTAAGIRSSDADKLVGSVRNLAPAIDSYILIEAGRLRPQAARLLPQPRGAADGGERGAAGRPGVARAADGSMGMVNLSSRRRRHLRKRAYCVIIGRRSPADSP
jgi:hypothetical protein